MKRELAVGAALGLILAAVAPAIAADAPVKFKDCALLGAMPNYEAQQAPQWYNWDSRTLQIQDDGDNAHDIQATGAVCQQQYAEKQGITDGSILEIIENYAAAMQQLGAEIKNKHDGYVVGHVTKDAKEYWLNVGASRDDGYEIKVIAVEPFKRTLLPPSGKDYRLLGHMPGYIAQTPTAKNFDEYSFPAPGGDVRIRGKFYDVVYAEPEKKPERQVTTQEIIQNYREVLKDLGAESLRDDGLDAENITARLDDHGQTVYLLVAANRVVAVEEKPFQMTGSAADRGCDERQARQGRAHRALRQFRLRQGDAETRCGAGDRADRRADEGQPGP
jgi:hypothetical protein